MKERLAQTLQQKLQQRLSPMQVRLVRMLEMSQPELEEAVRSEIDDNPALVAEDHLTEDDAHDDATFGETADEIQLADYRDEDDIPTYRLAVRNSSPDDRPYFTEAVADGGSLIDYLMAQLAESDLAERQLAIARYIIGNIDGNGYMTRRLGEIEDDLAFDAGIETDPAELKRIFEVIRSLDPAGVGAVDLRDCLMLQLDRLDRNDSDVMTAREIVGHYFDVYSLRHFDRLESMLGVDREALRRADELIRSLDPKPGSRFGENEADERARHIVPDFIVETGPGDRVTVSMPNSIPDLVIEESFRLPGEDESRASRGSAAASGREREAREFISAKRDEASDFIQLLSMRRSILMDVMKAIVRWQHEFFVTDDESTLRPMVLKDLSGVTGYDISVISRATAGKYVATQRGVYPLKMFFNERVNDEEESSSHAILAAIREIVKTEDNSSPLSDEAIVDLLHNKGFNIARRTVAKYRERLGIPVARLRKKI